MKSWKFWIPSSNRWKSIKTVDYLLDSGVSMKDIRLLVPEEQFDKYNERYPEITEVLKEQDTGNMGKIRNAILEKLDFNYFNAMLDDDIRYFILWEDDGSKFGIRHKIKDIEVWKAEYEKLINKVDLSLVPCVGQLAGSSNFIFHSAKKKNYEFLGLLPGVAIVILDPDFRFVEVPFFEDTYTCLKYIKDGKAVPKIKRLGVSVMSTQSAKGGIDYEKHRQEQNKIVDSMLKEFPFVKKKESSDKNKKYRDYYIKTNVIWTKKWLKENNLLNELTK